MLAGRTIVLYSIDIPQDKVTIKENPTEHNSMSRYNQGADTEIARRIKVYSRNYQRHGILDDSPEYNSMAPEIITSHNTRGKRIVCPWCNTVHWDHEQRAEGKCPWCWRLV